MSGPLAIVSNSSQLVRYESARRALAEACTVDEVKEIRDKAEAIRLYAQQAKDIELETYAAEIKLRAQRRLGELSRELEKVSPGGGGGGATLPPSGKSKGEVLKQAGISTDTAHRCEQLAAMPEAEIEAYLDEKREKVSPRPVG